MARPKNLLKEYLKNTKTKTVAVKVKGKSPSATPVEVLVFSHATSEKGIRELEKLGAAYIFIMRNPTSYYAIPRKEVYSTNITTMEATSQADAVITSPQKSKEAFRQPLTTRLEKQFSKSVDVAAPAAKRKRRAKKSSPTK